MQPRIDTIEYEGGLQTPGAALNEAVDELSTLLDDLVRANEEQGQLQGMVSASTAALQCELIVRTIQLSVHAIGDALNDHWGAIVQERAQAERTEAMLTDKIRQSEALHNKTALQLTDVQTRASRLRAELELACQWIRQLASDAAVDPMQREGMVVEALQAVDHFSI